MNYDYPGNVRELQNVLRRFCLMEGSARELFQQLGAQPGGASGNFFIASLIARPRPLLAR